MNEKIKNLIRPIKYRIATFKLLWPFFKYTERNLASFGISKSKEKMRSDILMQCHVVEKGLSLADVKPWFGQPKIQALINSTSKYFKKYQDKKILYMVVSVLKAYFDFHEGTEGAPKSLIIGYESLKALLGDYYESNLEGGFVEVDNKSVSQFDFGTFARSRHSVRSFTGEPINIEDIRTALKIAETTPSACNRQPWYNYVVTNRQKIMDILSIQKGSRQFKEKVSALIITSSSSHFFFMDEYAQMYFNSGLYAMNLLFALHSKGLGTIPLNMGIGIEDLNAIRALCEIPETEMPISLIAVGVLPSNYKYAKSARFDYQDYTKFI